MDLPFEVPDPRFGKIATTIDGDVGVQPINPDKATFTPGAVHVHDLQATILHLLGIDHERLTFQFQGLDARLTGVEPARVVREVLA